MTIILNTLSDDKAASELQKQLGCRDDLAYLGIRKEDIRKDSQRMGRHTSTR